MGNYYNKLKHFRFGQYNRFFWPLEILKNILGCYMNCSRSSKFQGKEEERRFYCWLCPWPCLEAQKAGPGVSADIFQI